MIDKRSVGKVPAGILLAVRASRLFDGEHSHGPSTLLIDGGKIVDVDTTGAPPPRTRRCSIWRR